MRLFVAVDLDDPVRAGCARMIEDLTRRFTMLNVAREVRWVTVGSMHLTVRFVGEVNDALAGEIRTVLSDPLPVEPFHASLSEVSAFPGSGPVRVVWLDVKEGQTPLATIHEELESRLRGVGLKPDDRPFVAHLTLARFRSPCRGAMAREVRRLLGEARPEIEPWLVDRVTLYRSHLSSRGPTYVPLLTTPLDG